MSDFPWMSDPGRPRQIGTRFSPTSRQRRAPSQIKDFGLNRPSDKPSPQGIDDMDRPQIADMIAASEARTDTKFAKLEGKLDAVLLEVRALSKATSVELGTISKELGRIEADNAGTRSTVRTTGFAVVGSILTVLGIVSAVYFQSYASGERTSASQAAVAAQVYNSMEASASLSETNQKQRLSGSVKP